MTEDVFTILAEFRATRVSELTIGVMPRVGGVGADGTEANRNHDSTYRSTWFVRGKGLRRLASETEFQMLMDAGARRGELTESGQG